MAPISASFFRDWTNVVVAMTVVYYVIMDAILYTTLQNTSLVKEAETTYQALPSFNIFHPLTIRLIVLGHTDHYIIKPLAEVFNHVTSIYHIVSVNIIIVSHVIVSIIVAKFVSSDNLRDRKIGVVIFELRTWMVCLAGVVYRSQSGRHIYSSFHGVYGTTANTVCDVIGGLMFCGGVCAYLLKHFNRRREIATTGNGGNSSNSLPTRKHVVLAFSVYGLLVGMAYSYLAYFILHLERFLEKSFPDPLLTTVQTSLLHSFATWLFLWLWRFFTQDMFQYLAVAVVLDKTWEYMSRSLCVCVPTVVLLMSVCYIYIVHMNSLILGGEFAA